MSDFNINDEWDRATNLRFLWCWIFFLAPVGAVLLRSAASGMWIKSLMPFVAVMGVLMLSAAVVLAVAVVFIGGYRILKLSDEEAHKRWDRRI